MRNDGPTLIVLAGLWAALGLLWCGVFWSFIGYTIGQWDAEV